MIPHISSKTRAYHMWDALTSLFQSSNENRKMVLREKLKSIKMAKAEGVIPYLTRISQVKDELAEVGEVISGFELVRKTLNRVTKPWAAIVEAIVARENLPSWDRLWDDFVEEETQRELVQGSSSTSKEDEENVGRSSRRAPRRVGLSNRVDRKRT